MAPSIALPTLYREALHSFSSGKSQDSVLNLLVHKGLPEPYARSLMIEAWKEKRARFRKEGLKLLLRGHVFTGLHRVVTGA
jgi:hypothetical protein